ncbi:MAG: DUF5777 family beta-barrel protein [Deltaproteobacteria bacterium]
MKRFYLFIAVIVIFNYISNAQDDISNEETQIQEVKDKPVKSPFETAVLIDFPTTVIPSKGSFQLLIHHRFGTISNGITDIYGIYAPSNIKMTFDYSLFDFLQIGFSSEKNNKIQEFHGKLNLLTQTRSGRIPVSVSLYSMAGIGARNKDIYGKNYSFNNRITLFEQLIISRKFSDRLSLLTGASYSHFNAVSYEKGEKHDHVGIHLGGRYMLWSSNSFIFEYTYPFKIVATDETNPPKQGFSAGLEFGTSTHGFQVFASNYQELNPVHNISRTQNDFFGGDILLGFNITIRF